MCRVLIDGQITYAAIDGLTPEGEIGPESVIAPITGHPMGEWQVSGSVAPAAGVTLLAPVIPSKIVCLGKNYVEHAREMGGEAPSEPLIFMKPSTSVIGPGDPIVLPWQSERVEHEGELAVVIGRVCKDVPRERVAEVIYGYTIANDVTARDLQARDGQWTRAKGFDTFCPLGPWIDTDFDPADREITCTVNGEVRQRGNSSDMVHDIEAQIEYITSIMTLLPGDVVLTGTPAGIGPLVTGDRVRVEIEGLGALTNPVRDRGGDT